MPGPWDLSLAIDPYTPFPTAVQLDPGVPSLFRWAAVSPDDVRLARQATAAAALGGAPGHERLAGLAAEGLDVGQVLTGPDPAPLSGGQYLPNYQYVEPGLWNSLTPEMQADVLLYGWPMKRPEAVDPVAQALNRAMGMAELRAVQERNLQERTASSRERDIWEQPEAVARGVDPELSGQALLNAMWLQRGLNPRDVYGYDPEWERQQANRDYSARMAALAQAMAQAATNTEMDVWNQRTRWALPEAGTLYSLQQPGGMIDSVFGQMGWAYSPTPAQHLPAPDPWANYRRALAEVM